MKNIKDVDEILREIEEQWNDEWKDRFDTRVKSYASMCVTYYDVVRKVYAEIVEESMQLERVA